MSLIVTLSLQAAAVATPAVPAPPPASGPGWAMPALIARDGGGTSLAVDIERLRSGSGGGCIGAAPGDVFVCGPRRAGRGDYPLAMWDRIYAPRPIRAQTNLGPHADARVYTEQRDFSSQDRGAVSNRVMIGLRTRF